jgi:archaeosortase A (PGF-CTERM-specific)
MVDRSQKGDQLAVLGFFLIPTVMLLVGFFFNPYPSSVEMERLLWIPLFLGLILLGVGFLSKKYGLISKKLRLSGWLVFSFYWATQPAQLYLPSSDVFNGVVTVLGVYVLVYLGYHEWVNIQKKQELSCLHWIAGSTFIAGIIYFTVDTGIIPELKSGLIEVVAAQSTLLLRLFGVNAAINGCTITYNGTPITIIFACTAIQSMVLFVGMIGALHTANMGKRILALLVTVVPIYFLNLIRNVSVIVLVGGGITSFEMAHNVIAKAGSLLALIILLFLVFRILPELYDELLCLFDLPKRNGPIEQFFRTIMGKKAQ